MATSINHGFKLKIEKNEKWNQARHAVYNT